MRFVVVPRAIDGGRRSAYEVIDLDAKGDARTRADRCRIGTYTDEHLARALATVLDGAAAVLDAEVAALDAAEPF